MQYGNSGLAIPSPFLQGGDARPRETGMLRKVSSTFVAVEGDYFASTSPVYLPIEGDFLMFSQDVSFGPFLVKLNVSSNDTTSREGWLVMLPGEVYRGPFKGVVVTSSGGPAFGRLCYGYADDLRPLVIDPADRTAGGSYGNQSDKVASNEIVVYGNLAGLAVLSMPLVQPNTFAINKGPFSGVGILGGQISIKTVVPTASYTAVPLYRALLFTAAGNYSRFANLRADTAAYRESGANTIIEAVYDIPRLYVSSPNVLVNLNLYSAAPYFAATTAVPIAAQTTVLYHR